MRKINYTKILKIYIYHLVTIKMKLQLNIINNNTINLNSKKLDENDLSFLNSNSNILYQSELLNKTLDKISSNPVLSYGDDLEHFLNPNKEPIEKEIYIDFIVNSTDSDVEKFHENTGRITITDKLVNSKSIFSEKLQQGNEENNIMPLSDEELLSFAIAHEVGHAIHEQMILDYNSAFVMSIDESNYTPEEVKQLYFLDDISKTTFSKNNDLGSELLKWQSEGFADTYASQAMKELYPDNYQDILKAVSFARKNEPSNYQTSPLIDNFMKDNPQFNNNEEFLTYFKNVMIPHNVSELNNYVNNKLIDNNWNFTDKTEGVIAFVGYVSSFDKECVKPDLHTKIQSAEKVLKEKNINVHFDRLNLLEDRIPKELLKSLNNVLPAKNNVDKNGLSSKNIYNKFLHVNNMPPVKNNLMQSFKEDLMRNQPQIEQNQIKKSIKYKLGL